MSRIVRIAWLLVAAIYLAACSAVPVSPVDDRSAKADCAAPPATPQENAAEPMPCTAPAPVPSPAPVQAIGVILLTVGLIAIIAAALRAAASPGWPAYQP